MLVPSRSSDSTSHRPDASAFFRRESELVARELALLDRERNVEMHEALMLKVRRELDERRRQLDEREAAIAAGEQAVAAALELEQLAADDPYPDETQWWELQLGRKLHTRG
jgi:hypothetical protein